MATKVLLNLFEAKLNSFLHPQMCKDDKILLPLNTVGSILSISYKYMPKSKSRVS
jgi:hypothetical protein